MLYFIILSWKQAVDQITLLYNKLLAQNLLRNYVNSLTIVWLLNKQSRVGLYSSFCSLNTDRTVNLLFCSQCIFHKASRIINIVYLTVVSKSTGCLGFMLQRCFQYLLFNHRMLDIPYDFYMNAEVPETANRCFLAKWKNVLWTTCGLLASNPTSWFFKKVKMNILAGYHLSPGICFSV